MIVKPDVILCISMAGSPQQHQIPFKNAELAELAISEAIKTGVFKAEAPDGTKVYIQVGLGTSYVVISRVEAERRIAMSQLANGGGIMTPPQRRG